MRALRKEEHARRGAASAEVRAQLAALRREHEVALAREAERKRHAHDAVVYELVHGIDPRAPAEDRAGCVARTALLEDRANRPSSPVTDPTGTAYRHYEFHGAAASGYVEGGYAHDEQGGYDTLQETLAAAEADGRASPSRAAWGEVVRPDAASPPRPDLASKLWPGGWMPPN